MPIRILLFAQWGLGLEAVKTLSSLNYEITVVTQNIQTKEYGDFVYKWCIQNSIKVIDALTDKDWSNQAFNSDYSLVISVSFGKKIPEKIYNRSSVKNFNIHQSLLPKYRGPDPISNAIMNGDNIIGISSHELENEFDSGKIYTQISWPINDLDTIESLNHRCKLVLRPLIELTISLIASGVDAVPQNHKIATLAPKLNLAWDIPIKELRESYGLSNGYQ